MKKSFGSSPGLFQGFFYKIWSVAQFDQSVRPRAGKLHARIMPSRINLPMDPYK